MVFRICSAVTRAEIDHSAGIHRSQASVTACHDPSKIHENFTSSRFDRSLLQASRKLLGSQNKRDKTWLLLQTQVMAGCDCLWDCRHIGEMWVVEAPEQFPYRHVPGKEDFSTDHACSGPVESDSFSESIRTESGDSSLVIHDLIAHNSQTFTPSLSSGLTQVTPSRTSSSHSFSSSRLHLRITLLSYPYPSPQQTHKNEVLHRCRFSGSCLRSYCCSQLGRLGFRF